MLCLNSRRQKIAISHVFAIIHAENYAVYSLDTEDVYQIVKIDNNWVKTYQITVDSSTILFPFLFKTLFLIYFFLFLIVSSTLPVPTQSRPWHHNLTPLIFMRLNVLFIRGLSILETKSILIHSILEFTDWKTHTPQYHIRA